MVERGSTKRCCYCLGVLLLICTASSRAQVDRDGIIAAPGDRECGKLPPGFEGVFIVPKSDRDQYGNPVAERHGRSYERQTGYPCEIWLREAIPVQAR